MLPDSIEGLPEELLGSIRSRGFTSLTRVQTAVAEAESLTSDLRISSQTGSGKTVAVGIAIGRALLGEGPRDSSTRKAPTVVLLTPTRELAAQVQTELGWLLSKVPDASVDVVTGGTPVFAERKRLAQGPRVVVGTPGRLLDHLNAGALDGAYVQTVVLDEADQMLDMGFRDDLEAILQKLPARNRTHLVSATFSGEVERIAKKYQSAPSRIEGTPRGEANQDIEHVAHVVDMRHRFDALVNLLLLNQASPFEGSEGRTLVFTRTRVDTLEVAERLQQLGIAAEPMSGDLAQAQRTRTLRGFKSGQISTIVATDVAARGLDVAGVGLVVHFDPPMDPDTMTHRSGRTGRAGRKGKSVLLIPPQARRRVERLLEVAKIRPTFEPVPSPDKVLKAYQKLFRRGIYEAIEVCEGATGEDAKLEESRSFAAKLLSEKPAELVVAALLSRVETGPRTAPREVVHALDHHQSRERDRTRGPHTHPRPRSDGKFEKKFENRFESKGDRPGPGHRPTGPRPFAHRPDGDRFLPPSRTPGPDAPRHGAHFEGFEHPRDRRPGPDDRGPPRFAKRPPGPKRLVKKP
jgi:ATP-dependent RNA helicase DeaD